MNPLLAGLLGGLAGVGVWAGIAVLVPAKPDLQTSLQDYLPGRGQAPAETASAVERSAAMVARLGLPPASISADLRALDRTVEDYLSRLVRVVAIAAATPVLLSVFFALTGAGWHPLVTLAAAIGFAAVAWAAVDAEVHTQAERERTEARRALAVVLSLTAMALSGGAGVDSALRAAAATGTGDAFERIQAALDRAALLTQTPWAALAELGDRLGVDDYEQLASTVALAGTEGARIRASLTDRADALRAQRLADVETDALAATERMSLPIVALACSFVVIVGYPALEAILTGL